MKFRGRTCAGERNCVAGARGSTCWAPRRGTPPSRWRGGGEAAVQERAADLLAREGRCSHQEELVGLVLATVAQRPRLVVLDLLPKPVEDGVEEVEAHVILPRLLEHRRAPLPGLLRHLGDGEALGPKQRPFVVPEAVEHLRFRCGFDGAAGSTGCLTRFTFSTPMSTLWAHDLSSLYLAKERAFRSVSLTRAVLSSM